MTTLEIVISKCENASYYSQLNEKIQESKLLTDHDKNDFETIWNIAADFNNWKDSDLTLGCKITQQRLKKTFNLSDDTIAIIVRCAAYDWK
ncbi:MAG: hypothetical protein IM600_17140 [Bacteroidetes bacterium]|jgi:hypothetical protein|nr:hypothetical protein [Bacteroidota bacterium]